MVNGPHTARADVLTVFEGKDLKVLCSKAFSFCCCIKWVNIKLSICTRLSFPRHFKLSLNNTYITLLSFSKTNAVFSEVCLALGSDHF